MPWKGEKDAYRIWLSEIILQQTRVDQGWNYYLRFIEWYPTVQSLASASDEDVFKLWEGLGYYSRCRNLLAAARQIENDFGGKFPDTYEKIAQLKGVGPYTAAAIASFAFNLPYAVVDGNVVRVLSRHFGIRTPFDTTQGKKQFSMLAADLLDQKTPGLYNQAIMDFGATVCKPANPSCTICPLQKTCWALSHNAVTALPVKSKKLVKKTRHFLFVLVKSPKGVLVRKRTEKDIWQGLHEFLLIESTDAFHRNEQSISSWLLAHFGIRSNVQSISDEYAQQLTHQTIKARFAEAETKSSAMVEGFAWVDLSTNHSVAFPKIIRNYMEACKRPLP